jgi:hypothetical protein
MGQHQCCCTQEEDAFAAVIDTVPGVIYEGNPAREAEEGRHSVPYPIDHTPLFPDPISRSRTDPPVEPVAALAKVEDPLPSPRQDGRQPVSAPLICEFDYDGAITPLAFTKRPLGTTFTNTLPLTVTKVVPGTEAEAQGIQPGWVFTKIGGVSLDGMDFDKIMQLIQHRLLHLARAANPDSAKGPSISCEFEAEGVKKIVTFLKQPLGMTFASTLPLTVTKIIPGSEAERRGVQSGWVCSKVGDVSLENMDLEKIVSLILAKSIHLPLYR